MRFYSQYLILPFIVDLLPLSLFLSSVADASYIYRWYIIVLSINYSKCVLIKWTIHSKSTKSQFSDHVLCRSHRTMAHGYWILDIEFWMRVCVCLCAWEYIVQFTIKYWHQQFQQALNNNGHWFYAFFSLSLPITIFSVYQNFKMVFVAFLLLPLPPFGIAALYVKRFGYMAEKNIIWRYKDKHKNWMRTSIRH